MRFRAWLTQHLGAPAAPNSPPVRAPSAVCETSFPSPARKTAGSANRQRTG
jgi:hypothetical protein